MKSFKFIITACLGIVLMQLSFSEHAKAAASPVSVGIMPPVQFPPNDFSVTGIRASLLYGRHRNMYGIDFGLLGNITEQRFVGIGLSGIFNYTTGNTTALGLQAAGVTNVNTNKTTVTGLQLAMLANINTAESSIYGLQFAAANISRHTTVYGLQAGLYNKARSVYGLQIGIINVVENLHGFQIGLINFNKSGVFSVAPIINFGF